MKSLFLGSNFPFFLCFSLCSLLGSVSAVERVVTSVEDTGSGTLRDAIENAADGDSIVFHSNLAGEIVTLTSGAILIANSLTIDGSALSEKISISGDALDDGPTSDDSSIFEIGAYEVVIRSLILRDARSEDGANTPEEFRGGDGGNGGAVQVTNGDLTIVDCILSNNRTGNGGEGNTIGGNGGFGGAIYGKNSLLEITNCTILGNMTGNGGRAASIAGVGGHGGGIHCEGGSVTIRNSEIRQNYTGMGGNDPTPSSSGNGGGIYCRNAMVSIESTSISENKTASGAVFEGRTFAGSSGYGGGVYILEGAIIVQDSLISGNCCGAGGNVDPNIVNSIGGLPGKGGGLYISLADTTIQTSEISRNCAGSGGDGLRGGAGGRGGGIYFNGSNTEIPVLASISHSDISENSGGKGGKSYGPEGVTASPGGDGGGIFLLGNLVAIVAETTIAENAGGDTGDGGDGSNYGGGDGGGVCNRNGDLELRASSVVANRAGNGGSQLENGCYGGSGGGIHSVGGRLYVVNSTIAYNKSGSGGDGGRPISGGDGSGNAGRGGFGGGVFGSSIIELENATITENSTGGSGSPGVLGGDSNQSGFGSGVALDWQTETEFRIRNSVVAKNHAIEGILTADIYGSTSFNSQIQYTRSGANLIGDGSSSAIFPTSPTPGEPNENGDFVGSSSEPLDPLLLPLADNGGSTLTFLPAPESPLIDPVSGDASPAILTDQRGAPRLEGASVDIGATEAPDYVAIRRTLISMQSRLKRQIKKQKETIRKLKSKGSVRAAKRKMKKIRKLNNQLRQVRTRLLDLP